MDTLLSFAKKLAQARAAQQSSLFQGEGADQELRLALPDAPPAGKRERLAWERELLGLYVTEHPFSDYAASLTGRVVALSELDKLAGEPAVTVAGLITSTQAITTKKGEPMLFAKIEDLTGSCEVVVFPDTYRQYREQLSPDTSVAIRGRLSQRDGERKVITSSVITLTEPADAAKVIEQWSHAGESPKRPLPETEVSLTLATGTSSETITQLKALLQRSPGHVRVNFIIPQGQGVKLIATPYRIDPNAGFREAVSQLLGPGSVKASTEG